MLHVLAATHPDRGQSSGVYANSVRGLAAQAIETLAREH
jgi:hypothetical protein